VTETVDNTELGPRISLLNDRQRKFVIALFDDLAPEKGSGLFLWAARQSGYGTATSSDKSLSVIASRVAHDDKVLAAIDEYARMHVRALSPEAVRALRQLLRTPKDKAHFKAIEAVVGRVFPQQTAHTVRIEDDRPAAFDTATVLKRIDELAAKFGLLPAPKIIDCEAVEIREAP
jgi:hypothetical protein